MDKNIINSDVQETTTISKSELVDLRAQLAAIHEIQAIAEYTMDGKVITANENYLNLTGYSSIELKGQDIGLLLDLKYRHSGNNASFWESLNRGDRISGKFKRIAKGVKIIWIQATYYPMLDLNGKPFKVVEYATDVTNQVQFEQETKKAIEQVHELVLAVKSGDVSQEIPLDGKTGEIASLCSDVNSLVECFATVITLVNKTGGAIIAAANKVNAANLALLKIRRNKVPSFGVPFNRYDNPDSEMK